MIPTPRSGRCCTSDTLGARPPARSFFVILTATSCLAWKSSPATREKRAWFPPTQSHCPRPSRRLRSGRHLLNGGRRQYHLRKGALEIVLRRLAAGDVAPAVPRASGTRGGRLLQVV